jgi:hypothetical protein
LILRPLPGTNRENLQRALLEVSTAAYNARGAGVHVSDRYGVYIRWARDAVRALSRLVSPGDIDRLVRTRAYWALQTPSTTVGDGVVALIDNELDERVAELEQVHKTVAAEIARWSRPGEFVVADTSFYIQHPSKLEDVDLAAVLQVREAPVHLLVPIVVVDELDGLKRASDRHTRWRARHTLSVLGKAFASDMAPATLRPEDYSALGHGGIPRGEVSVEIVFDPRGHLRLPINDDEIVDRALAIETLADRRVILLTFDTGQSTRGQAAGLQVIKLDELPEAESSIDAVPQGRGQRRRQT